MGFYKQAGFTLIELMIVVMVMAVLIAVSFPAYQNQVERGRLSEGRSALMAVATEMERCFTRNGNYEGCDVPATSESGIYTIAVDVNGDGNTATYTATATRAEATGANECGNLTINNTGQRDSTAGDADECWGK